jgi:hypothetical protein
MKTSIKYLAIFAAILFTGCSKDNDQENSELQTLWVNGYTVDTPNSEKQANMVTFLFFPANNGEVYKTKNQKLSSSTYYDYIKNEEDEIYKMLIDGGKAYLEDGTAVAPVAKITDSNHLTGKQVELSIPTGKYYVYAFYYERGTHRSYWNKYAAKYYTLENSNNPRTLTVVIPSDFTQIGLIPWCNWEDKIYEF